ncbi:MAG TPA: bifunctional oligoribonuclease/PAP phosphatase NrnA [Bacteroidota bacterium]
MNRELEQLDQILNECSTFVLTTHISPDCDGLGSEIAFASFLSRRGKNVSIINCSETPDSYKFLDPTGIIQHYKPADHDPVIARTDALFILDTNQPGRLAAMAGPVKASKARKIIIDHHPDADPFADFCILDESSAATGEIIYGILEAFDGPEVPAPVAQALYAAIMTDTGSFRFPKTDADLHRTIAGLIESGADPVRSYEHIYEQDSPNRVRLLGRVLGGLQTVHAGKVVYMTVTKSMFDETGTSEPDVDRFAPYALTIKGAKIGLMFTELPGLVKVSFRSKGSIPINELAQEFGGNGHKNAAGARITGGSLQDVIQRVVARSEHYLTFSGKTS